MGLGLIMWRSSIILICAVLFTSPLHAQRELESVSVARQFVLPVFTHTQRAGKSTLTGTASAVVISPGVLLTAGHVVTTGDIIVIKRNQRINVRVYRIDKELDLALLIGQVDCPCVKISDRDPHKDEDAIGVSFPLPLLYDTQILSRGHVQGINSNNLLITTTHAAPGGSGGGVFARRGNTFVLIGLITAIGSVNIGPPLLNVQQQLTQITFSVPASVIKTFVDNLPLDIK